ncbi:hypothetical protein KEM52_005439 [Ascosphaera acerosa]|nr:hypothetical protein KEM52_005439 [Ascosphaera acerosa]
MQSRIDSLQARIDKLALSVDELSKHHTTRPDTDPVTLPTTQFNTAESVQASGPKSIDCPSQPPEGLTGAGSKKPRFHGPTSNVFNLDVARSSLQSLGVTSEDAPRSVDTEQAPSARSVTQLPSVPHLLAHPTQDPLWSVTRQEALRLMTSYDEQVHLMYPLLDLEQLLTHLSGIYVLLESLEKTSLPERFLSNSTALESDHTCVLKLMFAIILMIENQGESDLGRAMHKAVQSRLQQAAAQPADLTSIQLITLCQSIFHFVKDDDLMAYRALGLAARMCLEVGLHNEQGLASAGFRGHEAQMASRVFWTVYTLDRRWSFGTGLPFVLQDDDITAPEPDESVPLLRVMVPFYRIGSEIWYSGAGVEGSVKREHIEFLDYRLLQWVKSLPPSLRYDPTQPPGADIPNGILRSQLITYIRANHMRMLLYRPVLHSPASIMNNMTWAQTVVGIAQDTIRVLTKMAHESDIYRSMQVLYNYFLLASIAVLLLAVSHAPNHFNAQVREEFFMALNVVKTFSGRSPVSKRLWRTVRHLHQIVQRLGLTGESHAGSGGQSARPISMTSAQTTAGSAFSASPGTTAAGAEFATSMYAQGAVPLQNSLQHTAMLETPFTSLEQIATTGSAAVYDNAGIVSLQESATAPLNVADLSLGLGEFFSAMHDYANFPLAELPDAHLRDQALPPASGKQPLTPYGADGLGGMHNGEGLSLILRDAF